MIYFILIPYIHNSAIGKKGDLQVSSTSYLYVLSTSLICKKEGICLLLIRSAAFLTFFYGCCFFGRYL
ncbi:MAG TPA: hypothetical protein VFM28_03860 [Nitrososphaeraceae archaeon]|nr:hypothetical protein [Nitrososphaeraceae archaeon]